MASFLIVDPEPARRRVLRVFLLPGHEVLESKDLQEANRVALGREFKAVFVAWPMAEARAGKQPEKLSFTAQHLLPMAQSTVDAEEAAEWARRMMPGTALTLLDVPRGKHSSSEILRALNRVLGRPFTPAPELVGSSPRMLQLMEQASRIAAADSPVLLVGEPGTGKRTFGRWIHHLSARGQKARPLEEFQAAGLAPEDAHAELFGAGKGSFPWAYQARPGLLESADGGTLYIHEILDLARPLQTRLLRALEPPLMKIERLGETEARIVDVRIIAGTRWPLRQKAGSEFSEELFYALSRNTLELPPLRVRTDDLPELAGYMLAQRIPRPLGDAEKPAAEPTVDAAAMQVLRRYPWPGNLDELEAALSEAALQAQGVISPQHLPAHILHAVERMG